MNLSEISSHLVTLYRNNYSRRNIGKEWKWENVAFLNEYLTRKIPDHVSNISF